MATSSGAAQQFGSLGPGDRPAQPQRFGIEQVDGLADGSVQERSIRVVR